MLHRHKYTDFCIEVGDKSPKMINWKCHTKDENKKPMCIECGTEKYFGMSECDTLHKYRTIILVKEWKLAPRTKDAKGNVISTHVELSNSDLAISEVVQHLKLQLEMCRTHNSERTRINCQNIIDAADIPYGLAAIFTDTIWLKIPI
jgi:hypothetical protein